MTHDDDFERDLRALFETPASLGTSRGAWRGLPRVIQQQDIIRRALQALAYAACAGAVAWWAFPALAGVLGLSGTSGLYVAAVGGAMLWGALQGI